MFALCSYGLFGARDDRQHRYSAQTSSPDRVEHYLRTGERLTDDEWMDRVECKFNPYHDPENGRFTFAPGGAGHATRRQHLERQSARKRVPMSQKEVEAHAEHAMSQYRKELARGKAPEEAAAWAANSEIESGGVRGALEDEGDPFSKAEIREAERQGRKGN